MKNNRIFDCPECGGQNVIDKEHKEGKHRCFRCGLPIELVYICGKLTPIAGS